MLCWIPGWDSLSPGLLFGFPRSQMRVLANFQTMHLRLTSLESVPVDLCRLIRDFQTWNSGLLGSAFPTQHLASVYRNLMPIGDTSTTPSRYGLQTMRGKLMQGCISEHFREGKLCNVDRGKCSYLEFSDGSCKGSKREKIRQIGL